MTHFYFRVYIPLICIYIPQGKCLYLYDFIILVVWQMPLRSKHVPVQSQQLKHLKNVWNMYKPNN